MATIRENAEKLRDVVLREADKDGSTFIPQLRAAAAKAIRQGVGSPAWETIMRIFADNSKQLEVLCATDAELEALSKPAGGANPTPDLKYAGVVAAYLAGGLMCTSETVVHLPQRISAQINVDLPSEPDANFEKPFPLE